MAKSKIVTLNTLTYYDGKIKSHIDTKDAATLKTAKDYADGLAANYDEAGAASTALADAKAYADGKDTAIAAAKKEGTDAKTAAATAQSAAKAAQSDVDALKGKVGTVPEEKTVVGMIEALQKSAYDDTEVRGLIQTNASDISGLKTRTTTAEGKITSLETRTSTVEAKATANADAITTLNGTGAGSVKKQIDDAFNDFATKVSDDKVVNTYKELIDYAATHSSEAAEMAGEIASNKSAISNLGKKVGDLPEGTDATTVVDYVDKTIAAEAARAKGVESGIDTRVKTIEAKFGEGTGSVTEQIATAKSEAITEATKAAATDATTKANAAEKNAKAYTDTEVGKVSATVATHTTDISNLKTKMTDAESDIDTLQAAIGANGSVTKAIADAKKAGTDAQASVKTLEGKVTTVSGKVDTNTASISAHGDRLTALETKVGDGFEEVSNGEVDKLFATATA